MADARLVVDLRGLGIETLDDFWDTVGLPCGLPDWFGRNLDAWYDVIENRGVSAVVDACGVLVVRVDAGGLFAPGNGDGERLAAVFADSGRAVLEVY